MFACCYGVAFDHPAASPDRTGDRCVKLSAEAAVKEDMKPEAKKAAVGKVNSAKSAEYTKSQELGGLFGRFRFGDVSRHGDRSS